MQLKFYVCDTCGKMIQMISDTGVPTVCCGSKMRELVPGAVDAAVEKHVPAVSVDGNSVMVTIGEVIHPMTEAHYIQWIAIETKAGSQMKELEPSQEPKAQFLLADDDEFVAAYAYCNLHGLWKK